MHQLTGVVHTTDGPVRGQIARGMNCFQGIPYASPPIGELRWRPPHRPAPWTAPLSVTAHGSPCAQDSPCFPGFGRRSESEDCLYLNVYSPAERDADELLPVMVWIPSGGLFMGSGNDYDPISLVKGGPVVFVSMNYRLNVFGFFSHPRINAEDHAGGNYGLLDQRAALLWVQANIEAFGGDPRNVTLFGESSGGNSAICHMVSPGSTSLFHKAIIQSGGRVASLRTPSLGDVEHVGAALATEAGCALQTPDRLRAIPTAALMAANSIPQGSFGTGRFNIGVTVDGTFIPQSVNALITAGRFNKVPTMIGVNRDEFAWFQAMRELSTGDVITSESYDSSIGTMLAAYAEIGLMPFDLPEDEMSEILQRYPANAFPSPSRALAAVVGDAGLICGGGWRAARVLREFASEVYAYEFDVPDAPVAWPAVSFPYGSAHTQELQFLFPKFRGASGESGALSEQQDALAQRMVRYWTTFAYTGTPNGSSASSLSWPKYDVIEDKFLRLQASEPEVVAAFGDTHHIRYWNEFYQSASIEC